jgi:hypothetical protein
VLSHASLISAPVRACIVCVPLCCPHVACTVAVASATAVPRLGNEGEYWGGLISCAGANPCNVTTSALYAATQSLTCRYKQDYLFSLLCFDVLCRCRCFTRRVSQSSNSIRPQIAATVLSPLCSRAGPGHAVRDYSSLILCTCPPLSAFGAFCPVPHSLLSAVRLCLRKPACDGRLFNARCAGHCSRRRPVRHLSG